MAGVYIDISGMAIKGLTLLGEKGRDGRDALDDIGAFLDLDVTTRFLSQVAPDGTKWQQSKAAYARGGLTLTDTRSLAGSVTHNVLGQTLEHGMGEKYAAIHHFGGKTGRNKSVTLPARPIIGIELYQSVEINNIVSDWLI
jgi:phage virion morphogenesis protein